VPQHSAAFRRQLQLEALIKKAGSAEGFAQMLIDMKRKRSALATMSNSASSSERKAANPAAGWSGG
jgi:hypothetical protein